MICGPAGQIAKSSDDRAVAGGRLLHAGSLRLKQGGLSGPVLVRSRDQ